MTREKELEKHIKQKKIYGYARATKEHPNLELQVEALQAAGCTNIFVEEKSTSSMVKFTAMLLELRSGDTLVLPTVSIIDSNFSTASKILTSVSENGVSLYFICEEAHDPGCIVPPVVFMKNINGAIDLFTGDSNTYLQHTLSPAVRSKLEGLEQEHVLKELWGQEYLKALEGSNGKALNARIDALLRKNIIS